MTVDGGLDVCHDMVLKDVLTPLVALFKQVSPCLLLCFNFKHRKREGVQIFIRITTLLFLFYNHDHYHALQVIQQNP